MVTQLHYTPARGATDPTDLHHGLRREVADMIRVATFAHRSGVGDLIWTGWNCGTNYPSWLYNGSHGIMVSRAGAQSIARAMEEGKIERGHIDLVLLDWLRQDGVADEAKACYVYPAVGSYYEHPSECDPANFGGENQTRPAGWEKTSCSVGTRQQEDDKGQRSKYLVKWKGNSKKKRDREWIQFPKDDDLHAPAYEWKSYRHEEEPTASSAKRKGKEKEEITKRAYRLRNQWRQREKMRNFVDAEAEAARG